MRRMLVLSKTKVLPSATSCACAGEGASASAIKHQRKEARWLILGMNIARRGFYSIGAVFFNQKGTTFLSRPQDNLPRA